MNLQIVLYTQKNPYLNQATPKKYLPNFPTQKNPRIENFKPKNILQSSLSLDIWSTPLGLGAIPRALDKHLRALGLNKIKPSQLQHCWEQHTNLSEDVKISII